MPQGNQQWTRVMVQREGERVVPLNRRMPTADDIERERSVPSHPVYITNEMEENLKRLMGITDEEEEKDSGAEVGEGEENGKGRYNSSS